MTDGVLVGLAGRGKCCTEDGNAFVATPGRSVSATVAGQEYLPGGACPVGPGYAGAAHRAPLGCAVGPRHVDRDVGTATARKSLPDATGGQAHSRPLRSDPGPRRCRSAVPGPSRRRTSFPTW